MDKTYKEYVSFAFNAFIAAYLEGQGTHRDDEEAVNEAMSAWFKASNDVKVSRLSEFEEGEAGDDEEDEVAAA